MFRISTGNLALDDTSRHLERDHAALTNAVAQLKAILASALDPIVTIDLSGTIHTASDSVERVLGWTPEELIGRNVKILMPSPHHESHDGYLANYRRTGVTNILGRTREFEAVRKDGTRVPIELSVSRVDVPGRDEPLFTGIIHDISERRELERELDRHRHDLEQLVQERTQQLRESHEQLRHADRLASIGTLAAGLGHDMNNVLLPIRARLDSLDAAQLPSKAREQFQAVRRSIAYLQQLSDGLHLLALDPEDAEATAGMTNLTEWWAQVGSLLKKAIPKRIAFNCDLPTDLPAVAVAPHRLTQAVLNLVVNAGEAIADEGVIRIWAKLISQSPHELRPASAIARIAGPQPPSAPFVQLGVTDTGEGMPPEVKNHALDPFFTTKKRGLGTGLGLSLVRGVAQAAGGSIDIESDVGKGTTVTLNLPIAEARVAADFDDAARTAVVSIRDRRAASFAGALLQSAGFKVVYAHEPSAQAEGTPIPSRIWMVEPGVATVQEVKRFVRRDGRRRVILFGAVDGEWASLGATTIDDPTDFDHIRRTIGQAIAPASPDHT